jgi:hypothetical protein
MRKRTFKARAITAFLVACVFTAAYAGAQAPSDATASLYTQLKLFALGNRSARANNLVLKKDRITLTFASGMLYFPEPVAGQVRGAVFIGAGTLHVDTPPGQFERDNVHRLLGTDAIDEDFKSAVLRFTDDTYSVLGAGSAASAAAPEEATKLAEGLDKKVLEETGANLSSRQLLSILNHESPGFFFAEFSGGHRGRFAVLLDYQARLPLANFEIDAGERGLVYAYDDTIGRPDVWTAFYTQADYDSGQAHYSDDNNLIQTPKYTMSLDVTDPKKWLKLTAHIDCVSNYDHLAAISFAVGEDLAHADDQRRKKQLQVTAVRSGDGTPLSWFQEPWEGGFTVTLPSPMAKGQQFSLEISLAGEFMFEARDYTYFPLSTTTWYPRHGGLQRSSFDVEFRHRKVDVAVSLGTVVRDTEVTDAKNEKLTEFRLDQPVALTTFALGPYEIHKDTAKMPNGHDLPVEFYSLPGRLASIKEDFIVQELSNCVQYFSRLFGYYPYPVFRGAFHPFGYGQGFATTLMIPATDVADKRTYDFIAHETAHQWWGDQVLWRSYRDQWLSEGFAEYSGLMYTQARDKTSSQTDLIKRDRLFLTYPPTTLGGVGSGKLVDVGPLIMGHRLASRETTDAYTALIYYKGALVLRMLHFLFTDPQTGDGHPFFDMMADFVHQYANRAATTDDFFAVVNSHVAQTPLAKRYGYKDINWFYRQWVLQTYLPSYRLEYELQNQPDGSVLLNGTLFQDGVPDTERWFMPLPLFVTFAPGKQAVVAIAVEGKQSTIKIKLPARPSKVELDPQLWVLSEKTLAAPMLQGH